jgi:hypothetical protein
MDDFGELEFVGPRESHDVIYHGWQVPFLEATPLPGGRVFLCLDRRFGLELALQDAERVVSSSGRASKAKHRVTAWQNVLE